MRSITRGTVAFVFAAASLLPFAGPANAKPTGPSDGVGTLHCAPHPHVDRDPTSGRLFAANAARIRTGPHLGCTPLGQGQRTHLVDYHCYSTGDTVDGINTWTYLVDRTTGVRGWVHDSLLVGFGSLYRC